MISARPPHNRFKLFWTTAILLLSLNGTVAIFGGLNLICKPDGSTIHLSPTLLNGTPFHNYLLPGLLLFFFNGILSIVALITVSTKMPHFGLVTVLQG